MPAPGYYSPSTDLSHTLLGFSSATGSRDWSLLDGGRDLRSFIIKELAEGEDMSAIGGSADLDYTASICEPSSVALRKRAPRDEQCDGPVADLRSRQPDADYEAEWLRVFEPSQRQLVKQVTLHAVTASPSSRAACLAVAAGLRARLLPPSDSRRQEFIKRSESYYNQAMQMLLSAPFEVQAGTLFDLMVYQVSLLAPHLRYIAQIAPPLQTNQYGAAAGYAVQELMDALVVSHPQLGPQPIPYIHGAPGQVNFLLYGFFALDALRALAFGRRTLFDIPSSGSLPSFNFVGDVTITMDRDILRGVTPHFFSFAARICNLAMDLKEGRLGSAPARTAAEKLEKEIVEWQPKGLLTTERSVEEELERFGTQEMWRQVRCRPCHSRRRNFSLSAAFALTCKLISLFLQHSTGPPHHYPRTRLPRRPSAPLNPRLAQSDHGLRLLSLGARLYFWLRIFHARAQQYCDL
jgi:hypothetical protein